MTQRSKPPSLYSYSAPTIDRTHPGDDILAILHTGPRMLVIKGVTPDANVCPLWAADVAHIKAVCALMYTDRDDEAIHRTHVTVVRMMVDHMIKRANYTMTTVCALNVMLTESQRTQATLSTRVVELGISYDAQFDWAEM